MSAVPVSGLLARDGTAAFDLTVSGRSFGSNEYLAVRVINLDSRNSIEVMTNNLSTVTGAFH